MPYRPRAERDRQRMHAARSAARTMGGSAMAAALAQIETAFDEVAAINTFKLRVERWLRLEAHHAALRARFGARAAMLEDHTLDAAIAAAGRWWRDERKAFQIASALGYGTRLSLDVLRELRLILRLMRYKGMQAQFGAIIAALCDEGRLLAAE
jgi:hypothetical protein